jgi:hypothetical protein
MELAERQAFETYLAALDGELGASSLPVNVT